MSALAQRFKCFQFRRRRRSSQSVPLSTTSGIFILDPAVILTGKGLGELRLLTGRLYILFVEQTSV